MLEKNKFVKIAKPLSPTETSFSVDIIIPFHGEYHLVVRLVESILRLVKYPRYKIILVDDASKSPNIQQSFEKLQGIQVIRHDRQAGFAAAVNTGVRASESDFVCVLHSDVEVVEQNVFWNLARGLHNLKNEKVAFISATTENPMSKDCAFLRNTSSTADSPSIIDTEQYLPFFCTMFSRPVFIKLGGFFEFPYCWFEDKLIAKKCHAHGYRMAYHPGAHVRHNGGVTLKSLVNGDRSILDKIKSNYASYLNELKVLHLK